MSHESTQERAVAWVTLYGAEERARGLLEGLRALENLETLAMSAEAGGRVGKSRLIEAIKTIVNRYRREHAVEMVLTTKERCDASR